MLAAVLALTVGVATPANADASTVVGGIVEGAIEAAPEEGWLAAAAGGGVLAATPAVLLGAGIIAYETRDSWLPVVQSWFNGRLGGGSASQPQSGAWVQIAGTVASDGKSITITATNSTSNIYASPNQGMTVQQLVCSRDSDGTKMAPNSWNGTFTFNTGNPGDTATHTFTPCQADYGTGYSFVSGVVTVAQSNLLTLTRATDQSTYQMSDTVTCALPDGTQHTLTMTATGTAQGVPVPSCRAWNPAARPVEINATDSTGATLLHVTEDPNLHSTWGDCFGAGGLTCEIRVWVNGNPCQVGVPGCVDWKTYAVDHPGSVQCRFGSHVVQMSDCDPLRRAYTAAGTQTITSVDPSAGTVTVTDPGADTSSSTSTIPGTGTNPSTGNAPSPSNADSSDCWGTGWSWNPVSWVVIPVKCALTWAFVPTNAPSFSDIPDPLPAGWLPSLPAIASPSCGPVTMGRLSLGYKGWGVGPTTLFDTCDAPWPLVRDFTYNGLLALLLGTVVWQAYRAVSSGVGMGVGINGGGDDE